MKENGNATVSFNHTTKGALCGAPTDQYRPGLIVGPPPEIKADRFVEVGRPEELCVVMTELLGEPKIIPDKESA